MILRRCIADHVHRRDLSRRCALRRSLATGVSERKTPLSGRARASWPSSAPLRGLAVDSWVSDEARSSRGSAADGLYERQARRGGHVWRSSSLTPLMARTARDRSTGGGRRRWWSPRPLWPLVRGSRRLAGASSSRARGRGSGQPCRADCVLLGEGVETEGLRVETEGLQQGGKRLEEAPVLSPPEPPRSASSAADGPGWHVPDEPGES